MKQQLQDLLIINCLLRKEKHKKSICNAILLISGVALVLFSCENNVKEVQRLSKISNIPLHSADSIEMVQTDSAEIQLKIFAPILEKYNYNGEPFSVFPEGITVIGYSNYPDTSYSITANYAYYYEGKELWEARNDVVVITADNEQINTEQLFWAKQKSMIYSDKFTRITSADGVFYGEAGFEANEDGTKWKLKNIENSIIDVKDE